MLTPGGNSDSEATALHNLNEEEKSRISFSEKGRRTNIIKINKWNITYTYLSLVFFVVDNLLNISINCFCCYNGRRVLIMWLLGIIILISYY